MAFSAAYRAFVAGHAQATVWHDADFLEALATDEYWSAFFVHDDNKCVGVLPAFLKPTKVGVSLSMPPLMRYMYPLVAPELSARKRLGVLQSLLEQAKAAAAKLDIYWPPFLFGESQLLQHVGLSERITYLGDTTGSSDELLGRASKGARRKLRRASEFFTIKRGGVTDDALEMMRAPFEKQDMETPYQEDKFLKAFNVLHSKGNATCHRVFSPDGTLAAAAVSLHDAHRLYLLMVGSRTDLENVNAGSLANYDMLLRANELNLPQADFLGSMLPGPAENRRQLGGKPVPYAHLYADMNVVTKALRAWRFR